jgi:uncharacterized delta-60 repeat protein
MNPTLNAQTQAPRVTGAKSSICAAALLLIVQLSALAGPGALDPSYAPNVLGTVYAAGLQPDGRVVIGGNFATVGGVSRGRIARLFANGTLDTTFQNSMSGAGGTVNCLAVQSDGRIVIGGLFSSVNNTTRYGVARLNPNGSLDGSFTPTNYYNVNAVAVQSDDKVIIGGGSGSGYVYRLNADGSMETAFTNYSSGPNGVIYAVAVQADGKIIIGGSFTTFNGTARNGIARLDTDGWLDPSFLYGQTGVGGGAVRCVQVQPDGKILIGGDFSTVNGISRARLARLTSTGAVDPGFVNTSGINGQVYALQLQADSRIVVGGSFSASLYISPYSYYSYNIARFNADGTLDASFACSNNYFSPTYSLAVQDDGAMIAGGNFTYVQAYRYLARVYGDLYPPEFTLQPTNRSVTVGTNVTLTALVSNPTPTTYQWRKNGNDLPGATGMSYLLYNAQMSDSGTYSVSAYNAAGSATSSNAVLNVGIAPGITVQPFSVVAPQGVTTNISVTATGAPLSYVWIKNGSALPGATNSVLNFPSVVVTNAGTYYVVVSNFLRSVTSLSAVLSVAPPLPAIITQPQSQTVAAGTPVTFSVVATNATSYIWRRDGNTVFSGSSTYVIPSVTTNQGGNYVVVVYSASGSVTSSVAALTVIGPPYFTVQPRSANTNIGATVTFSATVAGTPPWGLQWRKDGINIPYATLNTFTLANVQLADSGAYSLYANNSAGGATSSNAILNVGIRPVITAWSGSLTVTQGQSASFSVGASGIPLTYIWQKDGVLIPGATASTYAISSTFGNDSGNYSVIVSNALGTATTNALLTVLVPISITGQPASRTVGEGSNTTFTVTATGTSPAYQWNKNGAPITGATEAFFTLSNVQFSDVADYTVVVSNILNSVTSQVATLSVQRYPAEITDQPVSQSVAVGKNAIFSVSATGTTLSYQWLKEGTNLLDATAADLVLTNVSFADAAGYSVIVANPLGSVTSIVATLTVGYAPAIVTQPTNQVVPVGSNALFTVQASGTDPLSYQWRQGENALAGQTGTALQLNAVADTNAGSYCVLVSSPFGAVTSAVVTLTLQYPPQITQQPVGAIRPVGSNITFSVTATGTQPLLYQWQKDGLALSGATASDYSRSALSVADSGAYAVVVTNFLGSVTSSVANLTVGNAPAVVAPPQSSTNLLCHTVVLSCSVTGTPPMTQQWLFNSAPLPGETNATLNLTNFQANNAGYYALRAVDLFGATVSPSAHVSFFGADSPATWTATGPLKKARSAHTATLLRDGRVLVAGGASSTEYPTDVELYDPATGTWTQASNSMATARSYHTATLLTDGTVLVAGGAFGTYTASAEVYDSATGTWVPTGNSMSSGRAYHTATLLTNGKVLVAGGYDDSSFYLSSANLYDPATGLWTPTEPLATARYGHIAVRLSDGRVLVAGGYGNAGSLSSAELFDPATGTWTPVDSMNAARQLPSATLLPSGNVLVAGGYGNGLALASAELFNPSTGKWTTTHAMAIPSYFHTATSLPDGRVMVAGGWNTNEIARVELFDPWTGTWTTASNSMAGARQVHTATLLPNGRVLVAGGRDSSGYLFTAELYGNGQAATTVTLGNLSQTYDGAPKPVSVTTTPPGLSVQLAYNGSANPPTNAGSYTVIGTVTDACYQGSTTNLLVVSPAPSTLTGAKRLSDATFQFTFVNSPGAPFSVLTTTNATLPLSAWTVLDGVTEIAPGQFQFTDPQATNYTQRFYLVRSP